MGQNKNDLNLIYMIPAYILLLTSLQQNVLATRFSVTNNAPNHPGGARFYHEIGAPYTMQAMNTIQQFIYNIFHQHSDSERKMIPHLDVYISDFTGSAGYTNGDFAINISAQAIQFYPPGSARFWFTSLMYHEMTHIFQWSGGRTAPGGLTEGVADYVMLRSSFAPGVYTRPGSGRAWDEGYGVTERFLEYCDSLRNGFTVALNKRMRFAYSDGYFVELLGKPVGQLWAEYKAKYGNIPAGVGEILPKLKY